MRKSLLLLTFYCASLYGEVIDIISTFTFDLPVNYSAINAAGFDIQGHADIKKYENLLVSPYPPTPYKVIVWNHVLGGGSPIFKLPKEKLIFFLWEPWGLSSGYYALYSKIFTWDDSLVDNKKYFKFYYPFLMPMISDLPLFEDKEFCTMVASNMTKERIQIINFFETKPAGEFVFYGVKPYHSKMYRGSIPGDPASIEKISTLKKYRFCICFENTTYLQGYITEKIFACFAAGCVPIYWGATNVEKYIPKSCYIDYRDFSTLEDLYQYLKGMDKETHAQYIQNILAFLESENAKLFSPAYFEQVIYEAITE